MLSLRLTTPSFIGDVDSDRIFGPVLCVVSELSCLEMLMMTVIILYD